MNKIIYIAMLTAVALIALTECKCDKKPPFIFPEDTTQVIITGKEVSVEYRDEGGVKTIPVRLNGVIMDMILDTGCSGILISEHEWETLLKNGQVSNSDFIGGNESTIADGSTVQLYQIRIREIEIGEGNNKLIVRNKVASVVPNQIAPLLLGNGVLDEMASFQVNHDTHRITFVPR